MNKTIVKKIRIIDIVGTTTISSREIVKSLLPKLKKYSKYTIELDFSKIDFISRSAAHELIKIKTNYFNVTFVNISNEISEMLRIIAANIASPKKNSKTFSPTKTTFSALLS